MPAPTLTLDTIATDQIIRDLAATVAKKPDGTNWKSTSITQLQNTCARFLDIMEETDGTIITDTRATVVELPQYDDRGPAPLKNPQKAHVRHPNDGAHGL